jgi:hypothetical protein
VSFRTPWDSASDPAPVVLSPEPIVPVPKRRGRRPTAAVTNISTNAAPAWRYHHLTITGPATDIMTFAEAARGSGVIPWEINYAQLEEDIFHRAVAARGHLSIEGCHRLARQFCQRVAAHDARAAALIGHSRACPFDLQVLLPVPLDILRCGPTDPVSLDWLATHWGTRDAPRKIVERPNPSPERRLPAGHAVISYAFFTSGDTPQAAIMTLGARWSALRLTLTPRPAS